MEVHVGIDDEFQPARKAHPGFAVDDLDQWAVRLANAGHPVTWAEAFPRRRFYSQDPFGNRLGITDYSKAPELSKKSSEPQGA